MLPAWSCFLTLKRLHRVLHALLATRLILNIREAAAEGKNYYTSNSVIHESPQQLHTSMAYQTQSIHFFDPGQRSEDDGVSDEAVFDSRA